jgi:hypothetical protein
MVNFRNIDSDNETWATEESVIIKSGETVRAGDVIFYYHPFWGWKGHGE